MTIESTPMTAHPRSISRARRVDRQTSSRRVRDLIYTSLRSGEIDSTALLSEDELVREFEASRNAVRSALRNLANEGMLERQRRSGTKVVGRFSSIDLGDESVRLVGQEPVFQEVIESDELSAASVVRQLLKLSASEAQVRMVENTFIQGGSVIGLRSSYYSTRYSSVDFGEAVDLASLGEFFGERIDMVESVVGASPADDRTAFLLAIDEGSPVVFRQQLYLNEAEHPIALVFDHLRADRVVLRSSYRNPTRAASI